MDLRALQKELAEGLNNIIFEELAASFGSSLTEPELKSLNLQVCKAMQGTLETTSTMDAPERMQKVAASSTTVLLDFFTASTSIDAAVVGQALTSIPAFRAHVAARAFALLDGLRRDYLSGARGAAPASPYLNKTRPVYEFVRVTLGIRMHGSENYNQFANGLGVEDVTIGQNVSLIHEVRNSSYTWFASELTECFVGHPGWETATCYCKPVRLRTGHALNWTGLDMDLFARKYTYLIIWTSNLVCGDWIDVRRGMAIIWR